jgi:hypothetical protein
MTRKSYLAKITLVVAACTLIGCSTEPPVQKAQLPGTYAYKTEGPEGNPSDHEWDKLTIASDGKYSLVEGGPTKSKTERSGTWRFVEGRTNEVLLDNSGFPVHNVHGQIRFQIDYDVPTYYFKVSP